MELQKPGSQIQATLYNLILLSHTFNAIAINMGKKMRIKDRPAARAVMFCACSAFCLNPSINSFGGFKWILRNFYLRFFAYLGSKYCIKKEK